MSYERCNICGNWGWENHKCPPGWMVGIKDYHESEDDYHEIYAHDSEEAATEFASWYDSYTADYPFMDGGRYVIVISEKGTKFEYFVEGRAEPAYYAIKQHNAAHNPRRTKAKGFDK